MEFQLNFDMTNTTINGHKYSASSLSKQIREMIKEKRLFITRKETMGKPIAMNNIFSSVTSYKYNKGRCLFETELLTPAQKRWATKTFKEERPLATIEGIGTLDNDNIHVKRFRLTNLFLTNETT